MAEKNKTGRSGLRVFSGGQDPTARIGSVSVVVAPEHKPPFPVQARVLEEILADLAQERPMSRLLQGEVGSGKTVVATTTLLATVASGYQGAFMAPTEILAEQHYQTICGLLAQMGEESGEGYSRSYAGILDRPVNRLPSRSIDTARSSR